MMGADRTTPPKPREVWGPCPALVDLWDREIDGNLAFIRRLLGLTPGPWKCPQRTLRDRAVYGGRKGRRAIRRLRAAGARPINWHEFE